MDYNEILRDVCNREVDKGLYNITINDISVYNFIRRDYIRDRMTKYYGKGEDAWNPPVSFVKRVKSVIVSFWQLIKLLFFKKKFSNIFHTFQRTELINGIYIDKFTDPIIDYSNIGNDFLILEPGRRGEHASPRMHANKIIYTDFIVLLSRFISKLRRKTYIKKNQEQLDELYSLLKESFPEITINKDTMINVIVRNYYSMLIYKYLFEKMEAKRLIAPARSHFINLIPAAKKCKMKVLELQHGVTCTETLIYSGYMDNLFTPDYFLSFCKIHSSRYYGIAEDKVIDVGWAFEKYMKNFELAKGDEKRVMVVSSPAISNKMVSITCELASKNRNIFFSFRPHPYEQLGKEDVERLKTYTNVSIDNNKESSTVALMRFNYVIGENSTVLYEALSLGKNVGKLGMEELCPRYLAEDDKKFFYEIYDNESFLKFIKAPLNSKPSKKLYTEYRPDVINQLLK